MKKQMFTHASKTNYQRKQSFWLFLGVIVIMGLGLTNTNAQICPLSCNNLVQVSLERDCELTITPAMLLQNPGPNPPCIYTVVVYGTNNQPLPFPEVSGIHIGKKLKVSVTLDNGNSCWGEILVEDKYPPEVICPPDDTVFCNRTNYLLLQPTVTEFCSPVTKHTIEDRMDMFDCTANPLDSIIGKRTIRYYYTDASGNRSDTCTQCVYFQKFRESDIVWPSDKVFSCEYHDTIPPIDSTGVPMVDGEPIFPSWGACKIVATYEDQYIAVCPKSFKVIRKWTVIDWCMPSPFNIYTHNQLLKVVDDRGPVIACPNAMVVSTDVWSCTGTVIVPFPTILRECSKVHFEVGYKIKSASGTPTFEGTSKQNITRLPNGFMITGLPLDSNWVVFRATDECGNFTDCATEVIVKDQVPPVPVCDQKTVVSLTLDGTAKIEAFTFDDRSHDNCGISLFEAKRMDNGLPCNDTLRSRNWAPYVYFCCADINKTIMVSLRVWDHSGNFNVCMIEVDVQDKTIPLVVCPPDITVSCSYDFTSYDVFGTVRENIADRKNITINDPNVIFSGQRIDGYAFDGCGFVLVEKPTVRGNCGRDTIFRLFEATDQGGLKGSCTQRIVIRDYNPDNVTITWPNDYITQTVCIQMENINPDITGRPVIHGADKCNSMFTKYTDQPFVNDPDACIKIIRTWEVIDWCVYQPNNPETKGYWQWKQIVKIINKVPPTFINDCKNRTVDVFGPGCGGHVDLIGYAIDDCTDSLSLKWYYEVDLYNDGKADLGFSGASRNASGNYPLGTHKVTFRVWDGCDNISFCSFLLTVRDGKKPTPYCHSAIVTTVMPSGKFVEIWAKDYNINSEDNCTPKDSLKYFFKTDTVFHSSLRLDCGHIGLNIIRMYVFDQAGNYDYCEVTIEVQDPNKVCPNSLTIQGKLTTVSNKALSNVEVQLQRNNPSSSTLAYTDANGIYAFNTVSSNIHYLVKPVKNQDFVNGVSGQDIVMIQRHILGQENLNSAYRTIAADANNNGFVTAADITEIRKLVLGVISKYQNNNSWRFVPMAHQFADPNKPAPYPETIVFNPIAKNEMNTNFYAVKIGDVSGDASVNGLTNSAGSRTAPILINLPLQSFEAGEELIVPIKFNTDMILSGLQLGLSYDQSKLSFDRFENGSLSINDEEYHLDNGQIKMLNALPSDLNIKQDVALFYLVFKTKDQGSLETAIALANHDELSSEVYDDKISASNVELNFRSSEENLMAGVKLFYNEPNPFSQQTQINFELSDNQYVEFILYETNGKIIRKMNKEYSQGLHSLTIKGNELPGSGIYFLQMNSGETTETRRLVYIK
ncbi:MAG: T9SS type A sorting domain-containing protein [Saprospiraceae bacterium]|nr:T9SS type A sorting domain-containing protein [Saprospiraceae bacterium]